MEEATDLKEQTDKSETNASELIMEHYHTSDASKLVWRTEQDSHVPKEGEQLKVQIKPDGSSRVSTEENKQILTPDEAK